MNSKLKVLSLIVVMSCATFVFEAPLSNFVKNYSYKDISGEYNQKKTFKLLRDELISRTTLSSKESSKALERTTAVSKRKKVSGGEILLPKVAEHKVWFGKNEYYSKVEAQLDKKRFKVTLRSPEKKWRGVEYFKAPSGNKICWFSQLPECLRVLGLLEFSAKKQEFFVIWDSYPYYIEQLTGIDKAELFSRATISFDSDYNRYKRFEVTINDNSLFYFYTKTKEFKRYFWIAQGISMIEKE